MNWESLVSLLIFPEFHCSISVCINNTYFIREYDTDSHWQIDIDIFVFCAEVSREVVPFSEGSLLKDVQSHYDAKSEPPQRFRYVFLYYS